VGYILGDFSQTHLVTLSTASVYLLSSGELWVLVFHPLLQNQLSI
jgi:hypothetical protein